MTFNVSSQIYRNDSFVRENGNDGYRSHGKSDRRKAILEEEIRRLRNQMELGIQSEESFTSELAVRLSMKLDEKINEYHAFMKRYTKQLK